MRWDDRSRPVGTRCSTARGPVAPTHHAPRRAFTRLLRSTAGPVWSTIAAVGVPLLAALTALRWVDSPTPAWIPGLQAVVPVALPVAVVVLLLTAWRGPRTVAVAAGAVTAVHVVLAAPWWIPGGQTARTGDDPLVVLSSNVQFGFSFPDIQALVEEVRDRDADVLVLIEAAPGTEGVARDAGIDRDLPHAWACRAPTPAARSSSAGTRSRPTGSRDRRTRATTCRRLWCRHCRVTCS